MSTTDNVDCQHYSRYTNGNGTFCATCGVRLETDYQFPPKVPMFEFPKGVTYSPLVDQHARIADALERIATALEKRNSKEGIFDE